MKFKLRAFCKDTKDLQDIKEYKIKDKELMLTSDFKGNEYKLDDTEYVVIYTETLTNILDTVYENGKKANTYTPKKPKDTKDVVEVKETE